MSKRTILTLSAAFAALSTFQPAHAAGPPDVATDEIVVTASPIGRSVNDSIIGVQVLDEEDLARRSGNTIGEMLRREPGVSSTFFGPGASRPVIRGLGGDRISVLDSGIGSIDAASTSPDHAVAVEPATTERVEIVRGAATLLYGSSAAGGVVNVISGRIPRATPEGGIDASMRVGGSTVDDGVDAAGATDVTLFKLGDGAFVAHGEAAFRDAGDYSIPGFEQSARFRQALIAAGETPDDAAGVQRNSDFRADSHAFGLSYVKGDSFAGLSMSAIDTNYGVPGVETEADGSGPTIKLRQRRTDFDSEINADALLFKTIRLRMGYADYSHQEFEPDGEPGTIFDNVGWEGRLELVQKDWRQLRGAWGFQWKKRDFAAIGDEAFLTPTKTFQWGVFGMQELSLGPWRLEAGARYEATAHENSLAGRREFDSVSLSGGIGWKPSEHVFLGVTGLRTERAPAPEELFSEGKHLATFSYERGDPNLRPEIARGVEATAKFTYARFALTVNGYHTSYKNFIFENNTGLIFTTSDGDELPIIQFTATPATFQGFETQLEAELFTLGGFDVHADASLDYVRAKAKASPTGDLPRIPPMHGIFGVEAKADAVELRGEIEYAAAQNRIGALELPTDSHTLYNLYLTLRPMKSAPNLAIRFAGENLTNQEARAHTSFLKDRVPLPGRNFKLSLSASF
ncbi:MAG: TonB-dependent receptor [Parvularculaceae bacterium]|nr:TonB-dependent receptor [Parvularculaceae bacterium]